MRGDAVVFMVESLQWFVCVTRHGGYNSTRSFYTVDCRSEYSNLIVLILEQMLIQSLPQ